MRWPACLPRAPAAARRHSGELAATAIDRVEALDGLFARWLPAAMLALAGPVLVGCAALWADPFAGAVLVGAGLLVPVGDGARRHRRRRWPRAASSSR